MFLISFIRLDEFQIVTNLKLELCLVKLNIFPNTSNKLQTLL